MGRTNKDVRYIQCGKHGEKRRWSIVCIHLLKADSKTWIPIPTQDADLNDWVCPKCDERWNEFMKTGNIDDLRPICVNCVDQIRFLMDRNYKQKETT